jgi:hypothetical protein
MVAFLGFLDVVGLDLNNRFDAVDDSMAAEVRFEFSLLTDG